MSEKTTIMTFFETDHLRLDELLQNYMKWKNQFPLKARDCFLQFRYGLQQHIFWEEEILFPLFEAKTDLSGPSQILKMEHRQILSLLGELHAKLNSNDRNTEIEEYRLLALLGEHNLKEEMIIFPAIEAAVNEAEVQHIFEAINQIPRAS